MQVSKNYLKLQYIVYVCFRYLAIVKHYFKLGLKVAEAAHRNWVSLVLMKIYFLWKKKMVSCRILAVAEEGDT